MFLGLGACGVSLRLSWALRLRLRVAADVLELGDTWRDLVADHNTCEALREVEQLVGEIWSLSDADGLRRVSAHVNPNVADNRGVSTLMPDSVWRIPAMPSWLQAGRRTWRFSEGRVMPREPRHRQHARDWGRAVLVDDAVDVAIPEGRPPTRYSVLERPKLRPQTQSISLLLDLP